MKKDDIFEFFRRLAEENPSPETELESGNTYQLLVAVVLSAQSTDVGVNKATRALFREVTTPAQMVELGEEGLKAHIKTIGLFNSKAKNVIALSEILVRDFGGEVPADRDVLTTLPGVGRKTAQRLLVELKSRLGGSGDVDLRALDADGASPSAATGPSAHADVREALVGLGYGNEEIAGVVGQLPLDGDASDLLRQALQKLAVA